MRDTKSVVRTAEKIAGVIAVVAALVVLNGAWENQHSWQNVSWRMVMAAVLLGLAVIVQTSAVGILQRRHPDADDASVPEFLRTGAPQGDAQVRSDETVGAGERR